MYVDYLNPKFHDDGIVIVASRACQRGPFLPRERVLGLKIMFLDPKEVSKPKMALIEVVGHIIIDFRTKLQVARSMYEVRNPKNVRKSSREEEILPKIMILDPKEVSKPKMALIEVVGHIIIDCRTKLQVVRSMFDVRNSKNVRKSSRKEEILT